MAIINTKDLGEKLGLTRVTISRAINNDPRVSEKTRQRVVQAMKDHCLEPNAFARALVRGRTLTIGLAIGGDLQENYVHELMEGLEPPFESKNYSILIGVSKFNPERERIELSSMLAHRVEGIVSQPLIHNQDYYTKLIEQNTPIVFVADYLNLPGASWVVSDVTHDIRLAINHLLELGHRKIAFVGTKSPSLQHISRPNIYRQVLREAGISVPDPYYIEGIEGGKEDIYKAVHQLMKSPDPPTAFLGSIDLIAIYIIDQLVRDGYKVPCDISVIGIGNMVVGRYEMIALSTIDEDRQKMGRTAAKIMLDKIENNQLAPRRIFTPGKLIRRNTTATLNRKKVRGE